MFEEHIDVMSTQAGYFVERVVYSVLRATVLLVDHCAQTDNSSNAHQQTDSTTTSGNNNSSSNNGLGFHAAWSSLRLLRGIPPDVAYHISATLGDGVLSIIKYSSF